MNRKDLRSLNFEQLTRACGCDRDAQNWLKVAVDPFHDYNVQLAGIPDNDSQSSAIQMVPKVYQITAPAGLDAGETWSAHIATLPLASTHLANSYWRQDVTDATGDASLNVGDNTWEGPVGTITVITHGDNPGTYGTGNMSYPVTKHQGLDFGLDANATPAKRTSVAFSLDDDNKATMKKLIAGGFEVHNDTAALYKQGSVTVYSSGQGIQRDCSRVRYGSASVDYNDQNIRRSRQPPESKAAAGSMPDARTFEAAEGCYVPIRLGDDTHYSISTRSNFATESYDTTDSSVETAGFITRPLDTAFVYKKFTGMHRPLDIETTGAYFSGLSPETTLTLTVKFVIELCPTTANPSMLYMASPTALYCPRAIELYHQLIRAMPPGVPVNFNAKGDWFRMATKVIGDIAPQVAPMIGLASPQLALAATAAGAAARVANKATKVNQKQPPSQRSTKTSMAKALNKPNVGRSKPK